MTERMGGIPGTSRLRRGVRFPHEDAMGQPTMPPGEVITYTMSPEEIAKKYGPPMKRQQPESEQRRIPAELQERANQPKPAPKEEPDVPQQPQNPPVPQVTPHFVLGGGSIKVKDLPAKAEALLVLLGQDAVLEVMDGVLVVRSA